MAQEVIIPSPILDHLYGSMDNSPSAQVMLYIIA
jgi:hypothetical protein